MEIHQGINADHTALWLPVQSILVVADIHLGYEEELRKKGVHLPLGEFNHQKKLFTRLLEQYKPKTIVLNGDLKHSFGSINRTEWKHTLELLDLLTATSNVVIIKGNHDTILEPIARKKSIAIRNYYKDNELLFLHGDVLPEPHLLEAVQTIIIGHEHPAIGLTNGIRTEQYKCFLKLLWQKRTLIVQPSTFSLTTGVDVLTHELKSPFLSDINKAHVYIVGEDTILDFGRLNKI